MERICSNCKKEYNENFRVCPFCGEKNKKEIDEEKLKALGCPKTYMTESVLATIFCCFPVGIFGIINANKVESFYRKEQYKKAFVASQKARKLFIASLVTGIVVGLSMIIWGIVYVSNQATYINLSEEYISTGPRRERVYVTVNTDGGVWECGKNGWCHIWGVVKKGGDGEGFELVIDENTTGKDRATKIVVSSGWLKKELKIEQKGSASYIKAIPSEIKVGPRGGLICDIDVQTDGLWRVKEVPDFVDIEFEGHNSNKLCINVGCNMDIYSDSEERSGNIVLVADDETVSIPVIQDGWVGCRR